MARVLLFGPLRDLAGWREREVAGGSIAEIRAVLAGEDAELGAALGAAGVQVAVDQAIVRGDLSVGPSAEVAFLPPMSGG